MFQILTKMDLARFWDRAQNLPETTQTDCRKQSLISVDTGHYDMSHPFNLILISDIHNLSWVKLFFDINDHFKPMENRFHSSWKFDGACQSRQEPISTTLDACQKSFWTIWNVPNPFQLVSKFPNCIPNRNVWVQRTLSKLISNYKYFQIVIFSLSQHTHNLFH